MRATERIYDRVRGCAGLLDVGYASDLFDWSTPKGFREAFAGSGGAVVLKGHYDEPAKPLVWIAAESSRDGAPRATLYVTRFVRSGDRSSMPSHLQAELAKSLADFVFESALDEAHIDGHPDFGLVTFVAGPDKTTELGFAFTRGLSISPILVGRGEFKSLVESVLGSNSSVRAHLKAMGI